MRLNDYLTRINHDRLIAPVLDTLRELHLAHRRTFLFENLDIQTGRGIRLDQESLERKFLDERRGGYCFENNLLFQSVLRDAGFQTSILLARVRRGPPEGWIRTHMLLLVTIEGERWIADVGFGAVGILEPMPLREGATSLQGGLTYTLRRDGHQWVLSMRDASTESDLYEFTEEPQTVADVEMANHYTSTHPQSIFRRALTIQRAAGEERTILRGEVLVRYQQGVFQQETIEASRVREVARATFGVVLPDDRLLFETLREDE